VLRLGRAAEGALWFSLPEDPHQVRCNGDPIQAERAGEGVWKIPVRFSGKGVVEIRWNSGEKPR
jgi:hypothetical protein